jgi:hypothetical protein
VGTFNVEPSVAERLASFQDSIHQMLWPEKRDKDSVLGDKVPGVIDRTTVTSFLRVASGYVPDNLKGVVSLTSRLFPKLFGEGGIEIGPIPAGTPIGLLSNLNPLADDSDLAGKIDHDAKLLELVTKIKHDLAALPKDASDEEGRKILANLVAPLMNLSKCPDYVVNRGHYFGTSKFDQEPGLSDDEKRALIEFLKTF